MRWPKGVNEWLLIWVRALRSIATSQLVVRFEGGGRITVWAGNSLREVTVRN